MVEIRFSCPHCQAKLHVAQQFVGRLVKCSKCSQTSTAPAPLAEKPEDDSLVLAEDIDPVRETEAFAAQLAKAFVYPFKGSGIFLLIAATAVFVVLNLLSWIIWAIALLKMFLSAYVCAYYISVIGSSAAGEDEPPDWQDLSSFWDDVLRPVLLSAAAILVSFAPLLIYRRVTTGSWFPYQGNEPKGFEELALVIWGLLYLPMSLLAIALFDSVVALNPVTIVGSIAKISLRYLLACLFFFLAYLVNILTAVLMVIPIAGIVAQIFFSLYMMMVAMRILGLIYYANAQKLGWFED